MAQAELPLWTRRSFNAALAATFATAATMGVASIASDLINDRYIEKKPLRPRLKETIPPGSMKLGIYPNKNQIGQVAHADLFHEVGIFPDWHRWDIFRAGEIIANHQTPLLSVRPEHGGNRPYRYTDLRENEHSIRTKLNSLRDLSHGYFRFEYEMNAPWFPHGSSAQTPQEFIDGWQFMTELVKNVNKDIQMVWCPNIDYPLDPYYPGDAYVDVMALDGYNKHSQKQYHARNFHPNPSFDELFGQDIFYLQNLSTEKPIMIAELGVDPDNNSLSWLRDAYETAAQYDQVTSVYLFGWNKEKGFLDHSEANWGEVIDSDFRDMIEDLPAYRGPYTDSTYA
jgi:hypothetical protein